jgi:hypothetical protein
VDQAPGGQPRSLSPGALLLVALAAFGGPLALAGLYAPSLVGEVVGSSGWVVIAGAAVFIAPLAIWLRYSREIASAGGLFSFVEAAVGRRIALVQAALWVGSYALYLTYTSVYVVYDMLPVAVPGVHDARPALAIALPITLAVVVLAGRSVAVSAIAVIALGQVGLALLLDTVAVRHAPTAAAFTTAASTHDFTTSSAALSALFICGSLPLFLGGEVRGGGATMQRVLPIGFVLTFAIVLLAVYPLARNPSYAHAALPGMTVVENYLGHAPAVAVGLGIAASVVGVMLVEYVALTRLLSAVTGRSVRTAARWLAVPLVIGGPVSLIDPDRFYDDLLRPSLVMLWLAQLVVVVSYPWFEAKRGRLRAVHLVTAAVAAAMILYALWTSARGSGAT